MICKSRLGSPTHFYSSISRDMCPTTVYLWPSLNKTKDFDIYQLTPQLHISINVLQTYSKSSIQFKRCIWIHKLIKHCCQQGIQLFPVLLNCQNKCTKSVKYLTGPVQTKILFKLQMVKMSNMNILEGSAYKDRPQQMQSTWRDRKKLIKHISKRMSTLELFN